MKRRIIKINEEKCNGCGACADACHEAAIIIEKGKAKLIKDDYCDGLGDCLPHCPVDAISFEEREAATYNQDLVNERLAKLKKETFVCPGQKSHYMVDKVMGESISENEDSSISIIQDTQSMLSQWPVQIKLIPENAKYFENAHILIAADCTAYAYNGFHDKFIKNRITLIGCPKLDSVDYCNKLTNILKNNNIKDVTIVKMEVPCCNGILEATKKALQNSGKMIPWSVHTISLDGRII